MPFPALDLDITFELMSGVVALLVSYYAFRYNRLLENSTLKFISLGFAMLGIGLQIEAAIFSLIVFGIGDLTTDRTFALGTAALYGIPQVGAFFLFAFGYLKSALSAQPKIESANRVALALFAFPLITSGSLGYDKCLNSLTKFLQSQDSAL